MAIGVRRDGMSSDRDRAVDLAYRDHAPDVYRVAYAILRDADEAIDATHEAFARAWERWEQYDDGRPPRAWLHGIVVHEALDQLRRRRVRRIAANAIGSLTGERHPLDRHRCLRCCIHAGGRSVGRASRVCVHHDRCGWSA